MKVSRDLVVEWLAESAFFNMNKGSNCEGLRSHEASCV